MYECINPPPQLLITYFIKHWSNFFPFESEGKVGQEGIHLFEGMKIDDGSDALPKACHKIS